ncbi:MAG: V-type ATP synthase subunit F [Methanothrix sp.]|jgi:V/A-type H+-transporting ATPase subunit F|uniref:A-type ATP synthase subunit F n=1 Tax=Methanothrix thermoacetophila (strain DSM 6194 / JCM 14653 / NBRC 101360 / PT) TaxID=349307 RepID=AATF_METTP|nr:MULTISPECIES: V-type ATP synthase subunit F [Methanothrix]A0B9K3.1 RecName: Full=V-type ATP synthase subunit F; AltName: Full=V-ATPase subunit F [Methanothrix thermoacetophila PT]ABK15377.1 Vacuolar H+-transporting two-sector ATPase, F subunit [Methanothrix thermoacetophila PT]MBC7080079.1 V-type ATP synthase subunit F [Methanothrix sp.]MDI9617291.1 V-type ATP synthase subunit F [Methanothrix sp.]NPU88307.1 V-type ATP synthase subunit F [Methanothrix sp.]
MEIAVIGNSDAVIGFSLAGIKKAYEATSEEELINKINEVMADPNVGILVLHQNDYNRLPKRLQSTLSNSVRPTVIAIGTEQSTEMREKIKRAIGVDLWK